MARIYIPKERITPEEIALKPREIRYLIKVLRLGEGDEVTVFDGEGREYRARLLEEGGFYLQVEEEMEPQRESPLSITLAQGVLKGEKMKWVIQKATELGVRRIVPLFVARSVPVWEEERGKEKISKWQLIAQEAAKQSNRTVVPEVTEAMSPEKFLNEAQGLKILLWEEERRGLRELLKDISPSPEVTLVIGPEGGFTEEEVILFQQEGFLVAGLGKRILRAETAALAALAILQHLYGDLG